MNESTLTNSFLPPRKEDLPAGTEDSPILSGEVTEDFRLLNNLRFSSCDLENLPLRRIEANIADGNTLTIELRFRPEFLRDYGPAAQTYARFEFGDQSREVLNYWHNVYSAGRHNTLVEQWMVLDPLIRLDDIEEPVHAIELISPEAPLPPIVVEPVEPEVHYLNAAFERIGTFDTTYSESIVDDSQHRGEFFLRGDANGDSAIDITNAISVLEASFLGRPVIPCRDAADINDDPSVDITDPLLMLEYQFLGTFQPPAPGPTSCGPDPPRISWVASLIRRVIHSRARGKGRDEFHSPTVQRKTLSRVVRLFGRPGFLAVGTSRDVTASGTRRYSTHLHRLTSTAGLERRLNRGRDRPRRADIQEGVGVIVDGLHDVVRQEVIVFDGVEAVVLELLRWLVAIIDPDLRARLADHEAPF